MAPNAPRNTSKNRPSTSRAEQAAAAASQPAPGARHQAASPVATSEDFITPQPAPATSSQPQPQVANVPAPNTNNTPLYGSLNQRDAIYFLKGTINQFKTIIASAPRAIRSALPSNANRDPFLAEVLRLQQNEAIDASQQNQNEQDPIRQIMEMDTQRLIDTASSSPQQLRAIMQRALQADTTLTPRELSAEPNDLVITALDWQLKTHRAAQDIMQNTPDVVMNALTQQPLEQPTQLLQVPQPIQTANPQVTFLQQQAPAPSPTATVPRLLPTLTEPARLPTERPTLSQALAMVPGLSSGAGPSSQRQPLNLDSSDEDEDLAPPVKKAKEFITPEGFTFGSTANMEQLLSFYPGKDTCSKSLMVPHLLGPLLLSQMLQIGTNLPTYLNQFKHFRRNNSGTPTQSEMEAHTLMRMLHMEIRKHASPLEALKKRPSLEIGLRRLYAILYVEEVTNKGPNRDRSIAWQSINFIHESEPLGTVMTEDMSEVMARRLSVEKKRLAALQSFEQNKKRGRNHGQDQARRNQGQDQARPAAQHGYKGKAPAEK